MFMPAENRRRSTDATAGLFWQADENQVLIGPGIMASALVKFWKRQATQEYLV